MASQQKVTDVDPDIQKYCEQVRPQIEEKANYKFAKYVCRRYENTTPPNLVGAIHYSATVDIGEADRELDIKFTVPVVPEPRASLQVWSFVPRKA